VGIARFRVAQESLCFESTVRLEHSPWTPPTSISRTPQGPFRSSIALTRCRTSPAASTAINPIRGTRLATGLVNSCPSVGRLALSSFSPGCHKASTRLPLRRREAKGISHQWRRSGSPWQLRDFAVLLIDAARSLGFAARFASGYSRPARRSKGARKRLSSRVDPCLGANLFAGTGWIDFDSTSGSTGKIGLSPLRSYAIRTTRSAPWHLHRVPVRPSRHGGASECHVGTEAIWATPQRFTWPQIRQIGLIDAGTRTRYLDGMQRHSLDQLRAGTSISMGLSAPVALGRSGPMLPPRWRDRIVELRLRVARSFGH